MYLAKTPAIIKPLAKDFVWQMDRKEQGIYLTFDDGPLPGVTDEVLATLNNFHAQATFFCLGKNLEQHPHYKAMYASSGHTIGCHTYSHPDGWKTSPYSYIKNALKANQIIGSTLFRPPYGRITYQQATVLKKRFKMIMWDVISGDFDQHISKEECFSNVVKNACNGSIIVFHDSVKASEKMLWALPRVLTHFAERGFVFRAIPS